MKFITTFFLLLIINIGFSQGTFERIADYLKNRAKLFAIGEVVGDKKTGEWKYYYTSSDSIPRAIGAYENDLKHGTWTTYLKRHGEKRIQSIQIWDNGRLKKLEFFKDNSKHEIIIELVIESELSLRISDQIEALVDYQVVYFAENIGTGDFHSKYYDLCNFISETLNQEKSKSKLSFWTYERDLGEVRVFDNRDINSIKYDSQKYTHKLFGETHYINDTITFDKRYVNALPETHNTTFYYPNGNIKETQSFIQNDVKAGKWISNYENGVRKHIEFYKNGKLHGTCKYYNNDGSVKSTLKYKNGVNNK